MQWYYSKGGAQQGPVPESELLAKLSAGEISRNDLVWKEGMTDWLPASKVPAFEVIVAGDGSQAPPVSPGALPSAASPYTSPQAAPSAAGRPVPTYLWQAIVVTVLCCMPFGIPAIVYAAKVDGLVARGDIPGAMSASASAKTWCWVAFGCGLAFIIIYLVFVGMAGFSAGLSEGLQGVK